MTRTVTWMLDRPTSVRTKWGKWHATDASDKTMDTGYGRTLCGHYIPADENMRLVFPLKSEGSVAVTGPDCIKCASTLLARSADPTIRCEG